jgi:hypothetical protein
LNNLDAKATLRARENDVRKLLVGLALFFVLGGVALAWPYRIEEVVGEVGDHATGCQIGASNSSGWEHALSDQGIPGQRLEDPLLANIAVYECRGTVRGAPASVIVVAPDGRRQEACDEPLQPGDTSCSARLRTPPPKGGAPQHYRLLIQLRAGGSVHAVDVQVSREYRWRSGTLDAIVSV